MVDENRIIKKLERRIDNFVKDNPKEADCVAVQTIREFIHMLELEAKNNSEEKEG